MLSGLIVVDIIFIVRMKRRFKVVPNESGLTEHSAKTRIVLFSRPADIYRFVGVLSGGPAGSFVFGPIHPASIANHVISQGESTTLHFKE